MKSRRIIVAAILLAAIIAFGTIGYMAVERWRPLDALYMTVTAVSTVGFGEVHPLSDAGRLFTIVLVILGVGVIGFSLGTFIDFLLEGHLRGILEGRRMSKQIESLDNHTIVAGLGRVGTVVARELAASGAPFVVVDTDQDREDDARLAGWPFVMGDATEEETLRAAGIERAAALITVLDQDAENLFVTVTARALNPSIFVVARSSHESSESKLINAGANRVITPNVIGGRRMASLVLQPFVSDYLDLVTHGGDIEYQLEQITVAEASPMAGLSIRDTLLRDRYGVFILAVRTPDGQVDTNPAAARVIEAGDHLVVLGTRQQIADVERAMI